MRLLFGCGFCGDMEETKVRLLPRLMVIRLDIEIGALCFIGCVKGAETGLDGGFFFLLIGGNLN